MAACVCPHFVLRSISPAVQKAKATELDPAIAANVKHQVDQLKVGYMCGGLQLKIHFHIAALQLFSLSWACMHQACALGARIEQVWQQ